MPPVDVPEAAEPLDPAITPLTKEQEDEVAQSRAASLGSRDRLKGALELHRPAGPAHRMTAPQKPEPLFLGIDTGGTYTDAVLWSEAAQGTSPPRPRR